MKKIIIIALVSMLSTPVLFVQGNRIKSVRTSTLIPREYVGHWQKGVFSLTNFEQYNGKYVGPANETSISYVIEETGVAKEYFIANTNSYNCRMQILGYREGSIVFNTHDNTFEFEPTSGYYSTLTCMNKIATKKPYTSKELYPNYVVQGALKKDSQGNAALAILTSDGRENLFKKMKQKN